MSKAILGADSMRVDEVSEDRLWKTLDAISKELIAIKSQLIEVVRLEERVNQHDRVLSRFGVSIESHSKRIHESELWQAKQADKESIEKLVNNVKEEMNVINKQVDVIKSSQDIGRGQKDIGKELLKASVAILGSILVYKLTQG